MSQLVRKIHTGLEALLRVSEVPSHHRMLSRTAEAAIYLELLRGNAAGETPERALTRLETQLRDGLFITGDNVMSPPDTAFTANSLARLLKVTQRYPDQFAGPRARIHRLLDRVADALVVGGIHTPNHRWEITGALAACSLLLGREDCARRAREWLAEGIDVQPDGFYSERSPNYAAHVSGPSLWQIGEDLELPALFDIVHTNVHVHAATTDERGRTEHLQSRRQDQFGDFSVSAFVPLFQRCGTHFGCGDCLGWAVSAAGLGEWNYVISASDLLSGRSMPVETEPKPFELLPRTYEESGLAIIRHGDSTLMGHKLVDADLLVPITSGVNANPTLFRWESPGGGVRAIRLAHRFFNLGPLRPTRWDITDDSIELAAQESGRYYHPLAGEHLDSTGTYAMQHEGRFAAAMDFETRSSDEVRLETTIKATIDSGRCRIDVVCIGPPIGMALELVLDDEVPDEALVVSDSAMVDGLRIDVVSDGKGDFPVEAMAEYHPGDPYDFLGGTDKLSGKRVVIPLSSERPASVLVSAQSLLPA